MRVIVRAEDLPRDYREWGKAALSQRWVIKVTGSQRYAWYDESGALAVTMASRPRSRRGRMNAHAQLRRAGLDV